jgi:hypothetical protein
VRIVELKKTLDNLGKFVHITTGNRDEGEMMLQGVAHIYLLFFLKMTK